MKQIRRIATALTTAALLATGTALADPKEDWAVSALELQEHLDINQPFNRTFWVGTHNSYNAHKWSLAYQIDPNQFYDLTGQLDLGARELTLDVYKDGTGLFLCHGDCSGIEERFGEGLEIIRDWIDDGNQDSVIFLKLEMGTSKWGQVASKIEDKIADYVYRPREGQISYNHSFSSCHGLEPEHLTKADVLAEGKNIVLIVTRADGCPGNDSFQEWVHIGFEYDDGTFEEKFDKETDFDACEGLYDQGRMTRLHDGITFNDAFGLADEDQKITESNFADYMACGLNVFELFNYGDHANSDTEHDALEAFDMVWSWHTYEPSGDANHHCAQLDPGGRFSDIECDISSNYFACFNASTEDWQVSTSTGTWSDGQDVCRDDFPGQSYTFSVPHNPKQMNDLVSVLPSSSAARVWVNYTDVGIEGTWVADAEQTDSIEIWDSRGGVGGEDFDDFDFVAHYSGTDRRITNIAMRSDGSRVHALEVTYSDGTVMHHGGTGGSWGSDLAIGTDERIDRVKTCMSIYNSNWHVYFLKFETNGGRTISAGTTTSYCYQWENTSESGNEGVIAFYGGAGDDLDSIGFYYTGLPLYSIIDNDGEDAVGGTNGILGDAWPTSTYVAGYHGSDYAHGNGDDGIDTFIWAYDPPESGSYDISARWTAHSNRTIAEYELSTDFTDPSQILQSTAEDQSQAGSQDNQLWSSVYLEAGTTYYLRMDGTTGGYVVADSVTFERVE